MPAQPDSANLSVDQFAERHRREMIPLSKNFCYLSADVPLSEEDIREYLEEPIAALPPAIAALLPRISIVLVPYLAKANSRSKAAELIARERPSDSALGWTTCFVYKGEALLAFGIKEQEVADYHYRFYQSLARLAALNMSEEARREYTSLVRDELANNVHGEVDEQSWHLKQSVLHRPGAARRSTKHFDEYLRQSFIDTLTLYLHGICCDIDVDTGPRQLPSRYLRKRLVLLEKLYPAPQGYAVFPEQLAEADRRQG